MTEYQLAAMDRAGEHGEPIFRAPSVGCSGEMAQINPMTFVAIAARHLPGEMDPSDAWRFFQEASRTLLGREVV